MTNLTMDKIVALCNNRGFIFPGSDIYGGLANTWDYGPLGVEFKNNVKKAWWRKFVQESPYNVGMDCAILMNPETWVASGHVVGVVHAAAVVGSPAVGVAADGPDLASPDEVLDAEDRGVVFHPVRHGPSGVELGGVGALADPVTEGDVTRPPEGMLGLGAGARRVAAPAGVGERREGLLVEVEHAGGDLARAGGIVDEPVGVSIDTGRRARRDVVAGGR